MRAKFTCKRFEHERGERTQRRLRDVYLRAFGRFQRHCSRCLIRRVRRSNAALQTLATLTLLSVEARAALRARFTAKSPTATAGRAFGRSPYFFSASETAAAGERPIADSWSSLSRSMVRAQSLWAVFSKRHFKACGAQSAGRETWCRSQMIDISQKLGDNHDVVDRKMF